MPLRQPNKHRFNLELPAPCLRVSRERINIPFALAIARSTDQPALQDEEDKKDDADEEPKFRGYFNVAVETLLEGLFPAVATDMMDPERIGGHVKEDDIWCTFGREGIHQAGIGYVRRGWGGV